MAAARHALVIGNTDGIGLALSKRLLSLGFDVTGVSRRASPIESAAYRHLIADVSATDYGQKLQAVLERPVDVCIYCAGIGESLNVANLAGEAQVFRVNLVGAVETASLVLPAMIGARRGHFVALSSIGDEILSAEAPSYSASKAGLSSYLAGLSLALRPHGVFVSNVRFGFVDTKMAKSPVRPMMISVDKAVGVLERCLKTRAARVTYPWRMAALVRVLRWAASIRLWFS